MSIFGQVWLWSILAFFLGVLLTSLLVVLPLRKKYRGLESELARVHADAARTPANAAVVAAATGAFTRRDFEPAQLPAAPVPSVGRDEVDEDFDEFDFASQAGSEPTRTFEPEPVVTEEYPEEAYDAEYRTVPETAPEPPAQTDEGDDLYRAAATQYLNPVGTTTDDDPYRTAASEFLRPEESAGSLFAPVGDPTEYTEPVAPPAEPETPALSQLEQRLDAEPSSLFTTPAEPHAPDPDWFDHEPPAERSAFEEPMERTRYLSEHAGTKPVAEPEDETATGGVLEVPEEEPEVPEETPMESTQILPKRQPRESVRGGFDPPRPIEPSMRAVERREPDAGGHSGSLFEPAVQPNQVAAALSPEPPPAPPARGVATDSVPPGPFGPGSAMPRPGGGCPGEGFAVKASVTALRYCTEESAQFPKMVAEVWFRTAEDAERVGFRPLA